MEQTLDQFVEIALLEVRKLLPDGARDLVVEEVEEDCESGCYSITVGYWARDNKPVPVKAPLGAAMQAAMGGDPEDFFNPWRRKYKRVVIDPAKSKVIAIRMYEPPLAVS